MFGNKINSLEQVGQIAEGFYKAITNQENDLYNKRIKICRECPLYTNSSRGEICDGKKFFNSETNSIEFLPGRNNIGGCGCFLSSKARVKDAKCVLNKW